MIAARAAVDAIVNAVLYEGYILYPYRASSGKNRQRWTFGGLYPKDHSLRHSESDPWCMQVQCLAEGGPDAVLEVEVGFLQPVDRKVAACDANGALHEVEVLEIGARRYCAWQEAVERRVPIASLRLGDLAAVRTTRFAWDAAAESEDLVDHAGERAGVVTRARQSIIGAVAVLAESVGAETWRITVAIENLTPVAEPQSAARDEMSARVMASTHALLVVSGGAFVSLMDPPQALAAAAAECSHAGCYPVLVGDARERTTMLASPIILYDYPEVAPESPGDFFDGTEIDEMLALRILTMTDDEKREMAAVDERARRLLERTEGLGTQALAQLHGAWRALRTETSPPYPDFPAEGMQAPNGPQLAFLRMGNRDLKVNDRVRLKPRSGGDIMDIALAGRVATIESIERDFEDRVHVAVTVDDDPGRDLGFARMPGHRFFFAPEELEPV